MARRRIFASAPADDDPELPEHLRTCIVEDWHSPATAWPDIDPVVVAWGRWRRARDQWADEHGMGRRALATRWPTSRPEIDPRNPTPNRRRTPR